MFTIQQLWLTDYKKIHKQIARTQAGELQEPIDRLLFSLFCKEKMGRRGANNNTKAPSIIARTRFVRTNNITINSYKKDIHLCPQVGSFSTAYTPKAAKTNSATNNEQKNEFSCVLAGLWMELIVGICLTVSLVKKVTYYFCACSYVHVAGTSSMILVKPLARDPASQTYVRARAL